MNILFVLSEKIYKYAKSFDLNCEKKENYK